jgi:hypothetical protein
MKRFFHWLFSRLVVTETPPALEAGAVATRTGKEWSNGLFEWNVVVQIRNASADYDAVFSIRCISPAPPSVADILTHYRGRPQDFEFIDFRPNLNKK